VRDAAGEHAERRGDAVLLPDGAAAVREQGERQPVFGCELPVRLRRVGADADHLGARVLEVLVLVPERARFLRAAGRVVLRIEVEDDGLPTELAQPDRLPGPIGEREVRRPFADLDAATGREEVEQAHAARCSTPRYSRSN